MFAQHNILYIPIIKLSIISYLIPIYYIDYIYIHLYAGILITLSANMDKNLVLNKYLYKIKLLRRIFDHV